MVTLFKVSKLVGAVALYGSLAYNFTFISLFLRYISQCSSGGCTNDSGGGSLNTDNMHNDCYKILSQSYYFYNPILIATVIILLSDYRNPNYLQWWLVFHLSFMVVCALGSVCVHRVYDTFQMVSHIIGITLMTCCFVLIAYRLAKIFRSTADEADSSTEESNA